MKYRVKCTRKRPAIGVINPQRPHMTQAVVSFDHDTFAQIRERATRNRTSFAEEVRTLVEWGLEQARMAHGGRAA